VSTLRKEFVAAAIWHGDLGRAEAMLKAHPELASSDIHTAAVLGDDEAVRRFIAQDPKNVAAKSPPYDGDALNYLCMSKYLRLDASRSDAFLRAATALLDAGADAKTGFMHEGEFETALYGAAGIAHHAALTRLLLERGADPNDEEAVYHSPEARDLGGMQALVETGRVTPVNLVMMLIRKHDWHDYDGLKWLLEQGADPNRGHERDWHPIHHAIARDNDLKFIELLLDHGADPATMKNGISAVARAAHRGRGDLLAMFERRGFPVALEAADRLIAACARGDEPAVRALAEREPALVREVVTGGGKLLAEFTCTGNGAGVRLLLDLGVPATALYGGDGYYDIAGDSTALHVAAWMLDTDIVRLLIARATPVNARDGDGRTALMLAVKSCVDSYWTESRTEEPARALLEAGATADGIALPTGYEALDDLLRCHGTDVI
jgi:ankyrin repeat protein